MTEKELQALEAKLQARGYRKHTASLTLSARDAEGNRLETVEVSLRTFAVVQSRARCNGTSTRHAEILALVNSNMHLIRAAAEVKAPA